MSDVIVIISPDDIISIEESSDETISVVIAADEIITVNFNDGSPSPNPTAQQTIIAGENLSALKVVYPSTAGKMFYASNDISACKSIVWGLNVNATLINATGLGQSYGEVSNNTWAWTLGKPIFLGLTGEMTQVVPVTGFLLVVARPITATKIMVKIEIPINR